MQAIPTPQYHTFMSVEDVRDSNCIGGTAIVPQKVYTASNTHANFEPEATLEFWQGELRGVALRDATQDTFLQGDTGITDGNVPITRVLTAEKIMIRLEWPGYQPWVKAIGVKERKNGEDINITLANLTRKIAKAIRQFCGGNNRYKAEDGSSNDIGYKDWSLDGRIHFDQLILHELRHVSDGSYQPVLLAVMNNNGFNDPEMENVAPRGEELQPAAAAENI